MAITYQHIDKGTRHNIYSCELKAYGCTGKSFYSFVYCVTFAAYIWGVLWQTQLVNAREKWSHPMCLSDVITWPCCARSRYQGWGQVITSHCLNQWWIIVNWTLRNKFQSDFNRNSSILIQGNVFKRRLQKWRPICLGNNVLRRKYIQRLPVYRKNSYVK